jgi:hypothetical protein
VSPVEELRAAAALLRALVAALEHVEPLDGEWYNADTLASARLVDSTTGIVLTLADADADADVAWIVAMRPALGEPLAAWLEEVARQYEQDVEVDEDDGQPVHEPELCGEVVGDGCTCWSRPLEVARAINASGGGA